MSLLLETIKVSNQKLQNIDYHNERLNRSRGELLGLTKELDLEKLIVIPANLENTVYKCRILYTEKIEQVEFLPYQIKPISNLKLVVADRINYDYKFADRSMLSLLSSKATASDILMIKNGFVTDTSYANIVFFDGKNWITPSTPLLKGTKRSKLLREKKIIENEIRAVDIPNFQFAKIINAMIDLEESPIIPIDKIL
jgi:4-amino-4-deoxychorismate lyase